MVALVQFVKAKKKRIEHPHLQKTMTQENKRGAKDLTGISDGTAQPVGGQPHWHGGRCGGVQCRNRNLELLKLLQSLVWMFFWGMVLQFVKPVIRSNKPLWIDGVFSHHAKIVWTIDDRFTNMNGISLTKNWDLSH